MIHIIAQSFPVTGGESDALEIISSSLELSRATVESWNTVWLVTLDPLGSALWIGLIKLGITLGAASILFVALTTGKEIIEKQSWSELASIFVWPFVIMIFLGANGNMLAKTITVIRGFAYNQVQSVLQLQVGELTFRDAITNVAISSIARQQLENLYSECQGKVGTELVECWNSKQAQAQAIVTKAEEQAKSPLQPLRDFGSFLWNRTLPGQIGTAVQFANDPGSVFRDTAIPIIRFILYALQWGFVNILEAALLLTALFAPIAVGLSLLPLQGRPIWAWLTGFISLFGVQLGYNILVGLAAVVLVKSGAELASDVAFLCFLSIFAPVLAVLIAGGGGMAIYNGISANVKGLIDIFSSAIGTATSIALLRRG
ncbi:hypothetical protein PQG02_32745 (plasmid) [Nostoc sp. UHCC 0926]|jgi:hypothetical protein|nr:MULTISPECIES: hypothetical protein [unclassified Nostoc]MCW5318709.1 hypothetical protein [Nostoc sp. KVJ3]ODG98516.1 hypothetical protein A4S05_09370 [Nostoc sp. KVJ20]WDD36358.1 hypothetical protein PQG02_32745 [Nostoc sp. UHCC 0926]